MICEDLFIKRVDKDGNVTYSQHRVWDRERFLAAQKKDAVKEQYHVEQVTKDDFLKRRKK